MKKKIQTRAVPLPTINGKPLIWEDGRPARGSDFEMGGWYEVNLETGKLVQTSVKRTDANTL